jgi:hypothetical protein
MLSLSNMPGADNTGSTSQIPAFRAALAKSGRVIIESGTYSFDLTGDADTVLIPSNTEIECEPGVVFKWGYWGSPLFAIVNRQNVGLNLNGARFVWSGTFGTTSGARDTLGYGRAIPAYEWCAHIVSLGSEYVTIDGARCSGATTANNQNAFVGFRGKADGSLAEGNRVTNLFADDVCQGITWGEQKRFVIDRIKSGRYSNASASLYGMGHVLYVVIGSTPSEGGEISNIQDDGIALSPYTVGAHTVSLKSLKHTTVRNIHSQRVEGAVNLQNLENVEIDFRHYTSSEWDDKGCGPCFFVNPTVPNKYVSIRGTIVQDSQRDACGVNMGAITNPASNLNCTLDLNYTRTTDGSESNPAVAWSGNFGFARVTYQDRSGGAKSVINVVAGTDNAFYIRPLGPKPNPIVNSAPGNRNTFWSDTRGLPSMVSEQ